jgi:hypothetical protein
MSEQPLPPVNAETTSLSRGDRATFWVNLTGTFLSGATMFLYKGENQTLARSVHFASAIVVISGIELIRRNILLPRTAVAFRDRSVESRHRAIQNTLLGIVNFGMQVYLGGYVLSY